MQHSLKFTVCKTQEQTGFFVSFFFSIEPDKTDTSDRIYGKYTIWAIYIQIRGVKCSDTLKSGKKFFLHYTQNNCT